MSAPSKLALGFTSVVLAAAIWWRRNPSACPYGQRFWVQAPHPFITRPRLRQILDPQPGERILEVGPGTGYYSLEVAGWLGDGTLELLDLQAQMLQHTQARAGQRGLSNIRATQADATSMPFSDRSMDGIYLTAVLGEIPNQEAALREFARVLRPGGRLVVGELFGDPHWVSPKKLRDRAGRAGLQFDRQLGTRFGYFARFIAVD